MKIRKLLNLLTSKKRVLVFSFLATSFLLLATNSFAQTVLPMTVAPARQQLTVDAGERTSVNIRFYNIGDTPMTGILRAADFVVEDSVGTPRIIEELDQANPRFAASNWIGLPYDRMSVPAQDKVSVPVSIIVPANARPGGRYVAIYFEPATNTPVGSGAPQEAGAAIAPRYTALLYLRVSGDAAENALISRFFAPTFFEYGPVKVDAEILNRGDYHVRPRGVITISNMFGGLVDQKSLKEQNIFPDTSRSYISELGQKWMIGKYKVELAGSYGDKGHALTRAIEVWVFPWKLVTVIILAIILFVLLTRHFYKSLISRENNLETQVLKDRAEIEKLKEELRKKDR